MYDNTSRIRDTRIVFQGNDNLVKFDKNCKIQGLRVLVLGNHNEIYFKKHVIVNASCNQPTVINCVGGKKIEIGEDCLLSNNIEIHTSDYHGVYDRFGKRINHEKDVKLGKHVWIGLGCKILKGSEIADGCIVGAGTIISGKYNRENVIICGCPGKVIKDRVFWDHESDEVCERMNRFFIN